jgi:hypothetical protein
MARMKIDGNEFRTETMGKMTRETIRRLTMAGAKAAEEKMRENTRQRQHIRTGDMIDSIRDNGYREFYQGGATDVYPQGDDRHGVRNATKAYVINYGRGGVRKRPGKMGDKFITGNEKNTEEAVRQAMQAESDRLISEIE